MVNHFKPLLGNKNQDNEKLFPYIFKHLNDTFGFENIPFNSKQIKFMNDTNIPNTILKLNLIVDGLLKSFNYKNYKADNKFDEGYGAGYGFIYKQTIFIGNNFKIWAEEVVRFLISIDINNPMADQSFINSFIKFFSNYGTIRDFDKRTKFLDVSYLLKKENNVEEINKMVVDFFNQDDVSKV